LVPLSINRFDIYGKLKKNVNNNSVFSNSLLELLLFKEKLEDSKGVIRSRKSKKDKQYNNQMKKDKQTNNGGQNTPQITRDWATRIPLKKTGMNSGASEGQAVPAPLVKNAGAN